MDITSIVAAAFALGADAMSVCVAIGVRWHGRRQKFRLAWHMGLFQFLMPVAGWFAGDNLAEGLRSFGTYLAAGLVFAIGAKMFMEALRSGPGSIAEHASGAEGPGAARDPTRGLSLVVLSVATSMDALVVGFSFGLKGREIWYTSMVIGLVAGLMALAGVFIGQRAGKAFGRYTEFAGAIVLMVLGASFLWL